MSKFTSRFIGFALLLAFLPTTAFNMYDPVSEKAKIRAVCEQQVQSWRLRDYQGEAEVWGHKDYIMKMLTNGTRTVGWDKIGSGYATDFANTPEDFEPDFFTELSDFYIHINGKNAFVVFDQHQVFPDDSGGNDLYESLEVRFLEKLDGKWRIVFQLTGPYDKTGESEDEGTIQASSNE